LINITRALPALTIHTVVSQSKRLFVKAANLKIKAWGPTVTGLAAVPLLPFLFDEPIEHATEHTFGWIKEKIIERNQTHDKHD
jgi:fission process protein 1